MVLSVKELNSEQARRVEACMEACEKGGVVRNVKELLKYLKDQGIIIKMRIRPRFVGFHKDNRDGFGLIPGDVY